jgi:hypothetical protein
MKAIWKAINGQEFLIEADTAEEIYQKIEKLREEHNMGKVDLMVAYGNIPEDSTDTTIEELPKHIQREVIESLAEALSKPDPGKMN